MNFFHRKEDTLFLRLGETRNREQDSAAFKTLRKALDKKFSKRGQDINTVFSIDGLNPTTFASVIGQIKVLHVLHEEFHADLSKTDQNDNAPIHYASAMGDIEVIKYLIDKRIDINQRGKHRNTPLHYASGNVRLATVSELVRLGADVKLRNIQYNTPMDICIPFKDVHENARKIYMLLASAIDDCTEVRLDKNRQKADRIQTVMLSADAERNIQQRLLKVEQKVEQSEQQNKERMKTHEQKLEKTAAKLDDVVEEVSTYRGIYGDKFIETLEKFEERQERKEKMFYQKMDEVYSRPKEPVYQNTGEARRQSSGYESIEPYQTSPKAKASDNVYDYAKLPERLPDVTDDVDRLSITGIILGGVINTFSFT